MLGKSGSDLLDYPEESLKCPNCKEPIFASKCACLRNKCDRCGESVGNITFTVCDECWKKEYEESK